MYIVLVLVKLDSESCLIFRLRIDINFIFIVKYLWNKLMLFIESVFLVKCRVVLGWLICLYNNVRVMYVVGWYVELGWFCNRVNSFLMW